MNRLAAEEPLDSALTVERADGRRSLRFASRLLLAPMDGVTDRLFRSLVLDLGGVAGAVTEFLRISVAPVPTRIIRRELGPLRTDAPVGVQLMAPSIRFVPESVANAERAGAAWIDLNFGCPVKTVCGKGAGAALLDQPDRIEAIVRAAVDATDLLVSAKLRAGDLLDETVDAACSGGAALVILHARRRTDSYDRPADWDWITRAVTRCPVPLIGNGGVQTPEDARRMMRETKCAAVMVGRGAIRNPFLFREFAGAPPATRAEAAAFARGYLDAMLEGAHGRHALGRFKQLVRMYNAANLFDDAARHALLRSHEPEMFRQALSAGS